MNKGVSVEDVYNQTRLILKKGSTATVQLMSNIHLFKEEYFKEIKYNIALFKELKSLYPNKLFIVCNGSIIWDENLIAPRYRIPVGDLNGLVHYNLEKNPKQYGLNIRYLSLLNKELNFNFNLKNFF